MTTGPYHFLSGKQPRCLDWVWTNLFLDSRKSYPNFISGIWFPSLIGADPGPFEDGSTYNMTIASHCDPGYQEFLMEECHRFYHWKASSQRDTRLAGVCVCDITLSNPPASAFQVFELQGCTTMLSFEGSL